MNHGTATIPIAGAHSAQPSRAVGVLQLGRYFCCMQQTSGGGPIGHWALSRDMTCPEFILSGTAYTIEIENQLPNVTAAGLVAFTTRDNRQPSFLGASTSIWSWTRSIAPTRSRAISAEVRRLPLLMP